MAKKYGDELVDFNGHRGSRDQGVDWSALREEGNVLSLTPNFSWVRRKTAGGPLNRFNGLLTMPLKLLKTVRGSIGGTPH
jgi:hypothetical protein